MEFFKQVDLDWMGKAKYFFGLSFLLLAAGLASIVAHGGLTYGIDFKGGTVVTCALRVPLRLIRFAMAWRNKGSGNSTIVPVSDIASGNGNEVLINLEEKGQGGRGVGCRQSSDPECPARHAGIGRKPASRISTLPERT